MWDIRSIMLFICSMVLVILISLSMANADEKKTITPNEFANAVAETQYTQLPSDWSRVINVELNTSDHTTLLQQSTESLDLKRTSIDNVSGRPE